MIMDLRYTPAVYDMDVLWLYSGIWIYYHTSFVPMLKDTMVKTALEEHTNAAPEALGDIDMEGEEEEVQEVDEVEGPMKKIDGWTSKASFWNPKLTFESNMCWSGDEAAEEE